MSIHDIVKEGSKFDFYYNPGKFILHEEYEQTPTGRKKSQSFYDSKEDAVLDISYWNDGMKEAKNVLSISLQYPPIDMGARPSEVVGCGLDKVVDDKIVESVECLNSIFDALEHGDYKHAYDWLEMYKSWKDLLKAFIIDEFLVGEYVEHLITIETNYSCLPKYSSLIKEIRKALR